jgi:Flp pilus assembly protein TadD
MRLGRTQDALAELQIAAKATPRDAAIHCELGKSYLLLRQNEKARDSYQTAVKLQPGSTTAQYGLAMACANLSLDDEYQRAIAEYQKLNAAHMKEQRGSRGVAQEAVTCRRILAMTCSDAAAVYMGREKPDKAESLLRRGAAVDPRSADCRIRLVQLLCAWNRAAESVPIAKELIELEPNNAVFHLRLAMIYAHLERPDEARREARRAVELAPESTEYRQFLQQLQPKP